MSEMSLALPSSWNFSASLVVASDRGVLDEGSTGY